MENHFDVLVLGAGNAGQGAAGVALARGLKTAVVEDREVGGTCPLRGCVPKKVLVAAAETLDTIARAHHHHVEVGPAKLDWPSLIGRKDDLIGGLSSSMEGSLVKRGATLFKGSARFLDAHTVEVDGVKVSADKIVVATGSKPRPLPFAHLSTSEDLLNMRELPSRAIFVGAGVIAFEFAHVLARAGVEVTLLEVGARPLGNFDVDAVAALVDATERLGVTVKTGVNVEDVTRVGEVFSVSLASGEVLEAERVFHGAGRVPNIDDLDLAAAGVEVEGRRVLVDDNLLSRSAPHIGFAGDVLVGVPQLSPVATYEGRTLSKTMFDGAAAVPTYDGLPSAVYTVPALAQVGLTEDAARAQGRDVDVKVSDMSGWLSAKTYAEQTAFAKIVVERGTGRILGAHLVGRHAQETIHAFASAVGQGTTTSAFKALPRAYPTAHSDLSHLV